MRYRQKYSNFDAGDPLIKSQIGSGYFICSSTSGSLKLYTHYPGYDINVTL